MMRRDHRYRLFMLAAALLLLLGGCDKPADSPSEEQSQTQQDAPNTPRVEGKFSVTLKVSGTAEVYQREGAPKPEEVEKRLVDALYATDPFAADGARALEGTVTYDVKSLPDEGGTEVVMFGALNSPDANFNAGVNNQSTDEQWKNLPLAEMVHGAIDQFTSQIITQARVVGGDAATLLAILENEEEPEPARLMAIQEMRERKLVQDIPALRKYLQSGTPEKLRLAAAAALVSLGDTESRTEILEVAEELSRERDPRYVPMLHILGDLGGDEVITYLEAVAEGHAAPAVRDVAAEALNKARRANATP